MTIAISEEELHAAARIVYRHMPPTPQYHWPLLSERTGAEVWVKHENHTPVGAFKVRGGLVFMDRLAKQRISDGVISATRGNHGQSIAFAAGRYGIKATIVVPEGNSPDKNAAMEALGAELIVHGEDFQEALEFTIEECARRKLTMIGPFEQPLIAGVGTYALEFLRGVEGLHTVYVPVGMGSGICGLISARDALGLSTRIVGVVSEKAPAYALSFQAKAAVSTETANTLADGVACRVPDKDALAIIVKGADRIVSVSEDQILSAMAAYLSDTHNLAEGAGAVPLAALMKERVAMAGRRVGLVLSGGNADRELLLKALSS